MSSEPPEEPHFRNEPHLLSPASPKPIHFPTPTAIPVLEMQTDVGFNQTEPHMRDPTSRNTEVRPDLWKDPGDKAHNGGSNPMDGLTGEERVASHALHDNQSHPREEADSTTNREHSQTIPLSKITPSSRFNGAVDALNDKAMSETPTNAPSNMPSEVNFPNKAAESQLPADSFQDQSNEVKLDTSVTPATPSLSASVDVQALLKTLKVAPPDHSGGGATPTPQISAVSNPVAVNTHATYPATVTTAVSAPPGASQDISPLSASGLGAPPSGLPPRPPPKEQTSTKSNYVPTQQGQDFHARAEQGQSYHGKQTPRRAEEQTWSQEVQAKFDHFIEEEKKYVAEGRWEQFPSGSRLFVGNLSSERVSKREIFQIFHVYGGIAQISIKQAYGFVQFFKSEDCNRALDSEEGTHVGDKKIHLEVSKPPKAKAQNRNQNPRRSRSPDSGRGRNSGGDGDYYGPGGGRSGARGGNLRDGYRPSYRSPSPRGYRDRYEDRYGRRSRSPDYGRSGGRYRSPARSPQRNSDDDLPLPKRAPRDVPDVQIVVLDNLDRDFIAWVESCFSSRGVRVDVLLLSPRLSEQAVIRRQIVEGVIAVVKLTRANQNSGKIGLQLFDRRGGVNDVKFEEYDHLDPPICAGLVLRAKSTAQAVAANTSTSYASYSGYQPPINYTSSAQAPYAIQPQQSYPTQPTIPPAPGGNFTNVLSNLQTPNIQNILSALNQPQPQPQQPQQPHAETPAMQALRHDPNLAGYLQQQQTISPLTQQPPTQYPQQHQQAPHPGPNGDVDMDWILQNLGRDRR